MPARRKTAKSTRTRKQPQQKPARPRIRLTAVKAIIRTYLQQAVPQLQAEADGMDRLIRALRRPGRKPKRKAG